MLLLCMFYCPLTKDEIKELLNKGINEFTIIIIIIYICLLQRTYLFM